ncbi:MAG TPA: hypothetical protein PK395_13940 [bacterium]|nr:hypothetical protein [bacterium]
MFRKVFCFLAILFWIGSALVGTQPETGKRTVSFESLPGHIMARAYENDFPGADSNYHSLTAASDGKIYFSLNTHNSKFGVRLYRFDPKTEQTTLVGKIDEVLKEPASEYMPQGKIHTPLFEHKGKLWFATHTSFYSSGELPGIDTGGRKTYSGGHFMSYDLKTGEFQDLAKVFDNEGIITAVLDPKNEVLYGLTWPSGLVVSYDIKKADLRYWGAVQGRGEWGQHPYEWDRICRTLGVDPDGIVYGSTMDGAIWKYDPAEFRPIRFLEGLDLSHLAFAQSTEETAKGDFQYNWRAIEWNPATSSFWGIQWETTSLFEFIPKTGYLRTVADLRPEAYRGQPRNPEMGQLGFMIGPKNTVFHLAHGPAVVVKNKPEVQSALYLITYQIDSDTYTNHGPIFTENMDRVFFSESIAIGADDCIYTVAWVEVSDPNRIQTLQAARKSGAPAETEKMVYEMQLVRLPKWQEFVK